MDYTEITFDSKKTYHLEPDTITVKGTVFLSSNFESTMSLNDINSTIETLFIRSKIFFSGLWLLIACYLIATILVEALKLNISNFAVLMFYFLAFTGFILMLATFKKIKHIQFRNTSGIPVLAIAKSGPMVDYFEKFITQIRNNIDTLKII